MNANGTYSRRDIEREAVDKAALVELIGTDMPDDAATYRLDRFESDLRGVRDDVKGLAGDTRTGLDLIARRLDTFQSQYLNKDDYRVAHVELRNELTRMIDQLRTDSTATVDRLNERCRAIEDDQSKGKYAIFTLFASFVVMAATQVLQHLGGK